MDTQEGSALRFVSIRELRNQTAVVWKALADEKDVVITSNGKPIALLSALEEENLEASLAAIRRARRHGVQVVSPRAFLEVYRQRAGADDG